MRILAIALTILTVGTGNSLAADLRPMPYKMPPPMQAVYTWTGFYLGVNVGGGWSNANSEFSTAGFPSFAGLDNHMAGVIAGGQVGYNWQSGSWVLGVEADFQYSGMKGGISAPCPAGICAASFRPEHALVRHRTRPPRLRVRRLADLRDRRLRLYAAGEQRLRIGRGSFGQRSA